MDLIAASEAGQAFEVQVGDGPIRIAAYVFRHPKGVVFVEAGWCDLMGTKFYYHLIQGEPQGEGPWTLGPAKFAVIDETSNLVEIWAYMKEQEKDNPNCTREKAHEIAMQEFTTQQEA